jgi:hypothetical protein
MICDYANQVHIRRYGKNPDDRVFVFGRWVNVEKTPCHLGGSRPWSLCPLCGRRCAILYLHACRICRRGRYRSAMKPPRIRRIMKVIKLRERLGQTSGGTLAPFPERPKGMHKHTYEKLRLKSEALEEEMWAAEWALVQRLKGVKSNKRKIS